MNYYNEYRSSKSRWNELLTMQNKTDEERAEFRRLDTIMGEGEAIDRGECGAIPKRMARCSFDTFTADMTIRGEAEYYIEQKKQNLEEGRNLVIQGPVGVGKTHLAVAITWRLLVERPRHKADFWSIVDFVQMAKAVFDGDRGAKEYAEQAPTIDWLIIDDLGQERPTEWTRELIYTIVSRRYNAQRPTIVTTNLTPAEIADRYGDPVASRLFGDGALVLALGGKDNRIGGR